MPRRREIKGLLDNFLSSFTSRYSDYDGYWLFGFVVAGLEREEIDLLAPDAATIDIDRVTAVLHRTARIRFRSQVEKLPLTPDWIREARLAITRSSEWALNYSMGSMRNGYEMTFTASAVTDLGRETCVRHISSLLHTIRLGNYAAGPVTGVRSAPPAPLLTNEYVVQFFSDLIAG